MVGTAKGAAKVVPTVVNPITEASDVVTASKVIIAS